MSDFDLSTKIQLSNIPAPKISFWVNLVFTQHGYPQLRTCKNNCVFSYFLRHVFFLLRLHFFLLHEAIGNVLAYLFTPIVCLSKVSN